MKRLLQILLPVVILAICGVFAYWLLISTPEPERRRFQTPNPQVLARVLEKEDYQVTLRSQGSVRARTESGLVAEVRGSVVSISHNFQEGAFFEEGEVLLEIDDRDYRAELVVAEAALAQAELDLLQETARYDQASRDWERLNPGQTANPLTLREPQINQARAAAASARARVETARLNLERTKVKAPYAGRVLTKNVDRGQFVSPGNELARLYAVDFAEVRLPLTATQFSYLDLPDVYRGSEPIFEEGPSVTLRSSIGESVYTWEGRIVRAEGSIDTRTRQIFVVAQVEDPYGKSVDGRPPLKVGSFVQAEIGGRVLSDVYVVPRRLLRESRYLLLVDQESYLERRPVDVVWDSDDEIVIRDGLEDGELLCLTNVPFALEGWQVATVPETVERPGSMLAEKPESIAPPVERRRPASPPATGTYADTVIAALGEKLPAQLRADLLAASQSNDWSRMGPLMRQVREWAEANGEEMPPNPQAAANPRS